MYKISELQYLDLPADGVSVSLKGKFYYRIADDEENKGESVNCYITDSSGSGSPKLYLSNEVGEALIDEDETFGMLVGGEFAYYGLDAEISCLIRKNAKGLACESVKYLKLERDGESQEFNF